MAKFITSKEKVIEQYNQVKELGCIVAYSKKTNPVIWPILEEETDSLVACHSLESVKEVKDGNRIWYFPLAIDNDELEQLFALDVNKFVVDNPEDLQAVVSFAETNDTVIDLMLRTKVKENTIFTGKYFVFGMDSKFVNQEILKLRDNKYIRKLGLHFHRKSQNVAEWSLKQEMEDLILPEVLEKIDILDIGGGIPVNYLSSHNRAIERVFNKIKELREWLPKRIELMAEPGRYIAGPSTVLECKILAIHDNNIFVDFSIYAGAVDTVLTHVKLIVYGELEKGTKYTIKGKTPCSLDILRYSVFLDNPKVGDTIKFLNAGAYNYCTDFCHLEKPGNIIS